MKATPTQYAKTLYELTVDKKHQEIDEIISNFLKEIYKNGQMRMLDSIIKKFQEIHNAENGIVEAEVTTREKISESLESKIKSFIKEKYKAEKVVIHNKVDRNIKGGIIIRIGDEVMDGSIKRQLEELEKSLNH
ncbi:MAG: ATP synthase F1 subunit delta [Parcubacteria group bacterium]|jgi:F-type H+-transporting ATPase subunit delta